MTSTRDHFRKGLNQFPRLELEEKRWVVRELNSEGKSVLVEAVRNVLKKTLSGDVQRPSVFLSHSNKDKRFVRALAHRLKKEGIRVWLDEAEMKVGESLIEKLGQALASVDFLVVVLSQASIESVWVQKEVEIAMSQEMKSRKVKVLPILKETVVLPSFLEGKIYLDFRNKGMRAKSVDKLVRDILSYSEV